MPTGKVFDFLYPFFKGGILKFGSWVSSRLFQFADDIAQSWQPDGIGNVFL
jgi:hypothetical protein